MNVQRKIEVEVDLSCKFKVTWLPLMLLTYSGVYFAAVYEHGVLIVSWSPDDNPCASQHGNRFIKKEKKSIKMSAACACTSPHMRRSTAAHVYLVNPSSSTPLTVGTFLNSRVRVFLSLSLSSLSV